MNVREKTISIRMDHGPRIQVDATVYGGEWAAHKAWPAALAGLGWCVTSVTTGLKLPAMLTEHQAKKLAAALVQKGVVVFPEELVNGHLLPEKTGATIRELIQLHAAE